MHALKLKCNMFCNKKVHPQWVGELLPPFYFPAYWVGLRLGPRGFQIIVTSLPHSFSLASPFRYLSEKKKIIKKKKILGEIEKVSKLNTRIYKTCSENVQYSTKSNLHLVCHKEARFRDSVSKRIQ